MSRYFFSLHNRLFFSIFFFLCTCVLFPYILCSFFAACHAFFSLHVLFSLHVMLFSLYMFFFRYMSCFFFLSTYVLFSLHVMFFLSAWFFSQRSPLFQNAGHHAGKFVPVLRRQHVPQRVHAHIQRLAAAGTVSSLTKLV